VIRFEDRARRLTLSVRDLASDDDHRFAGPAPLSLKRRAELGRIEHEVHQESREEELRSYRRERSIRYEAKVDGWTAVVTGRIDGIYSDDDGRTVIEEVKTVVGQPEEIEAAGPETFPAYARQLQLYRYLLEEGSAGLDFAGGAAPEIALHLHLIALPSRATRTLALGYERRACREHVERRLRELIEAREATLAEEARRREAEAAVRFPHPEPRPHQEAMVDAVAAALGAGRSVLVSAPPGIGKTAAALVPAIRRACSIGGRVFVATSKTTQQAMFVRTIERLRAAGAPVRAVLLSARGKACLNDVVCCHPDACEFARDYAGKLARSGAVERLLGGGLVEPSAVEAEAREHRFCPFEAALDLTGAVDVIVGDFNYVFDPGATLRRVFIDDDPRDVVLVIDEAHNLYDRGMGYYSPALRGDAVRDIERALARQLDPISRHARGLARRLLEHLEAIDRGGARPPAAAPAEEEEAAAAPANMLLFADPEAEARERDRRKRSSRRRAVAAPPPPPPEPAPPEPPGPPPEALPPEREVALDAAFFAELREELNELAVAWHADAARAGRPRRPADEDPLPTLNRLVTRFTNVLELGGDEFSTVWRRGQGGVLKVLCKDPSRQLGRRIRACAGAVGVSATLEPLEFYRDVLGFPAETALAAFPSPFPRERRKVVVLDRPSTSYRRRERDLPIVEDAVRAVLASRPGNYLVCCPSFDYLQRLARRLEDLPGFEAIVQERYMDDPSRQAVLDRLRLGAEGKRLPVALLVVQGGIFTEGVDYPGELCVGAVVVGPALPRVGFERELIQAHFEAKYGRGFEYAFLFPGMSKVIQSAGRVIRTPEDQGVVALVGERFATARYANLFPRDWYDRHPRELISHDPYGDLVAFWEGVEAREAR